MEKELKKKKEKLIDAQKEKSVRKEIVMKINEEFRQNQEKVLTNKDGILHNFDHIYELNPINTIHLCEQLLK